MIDDLKLSVRRSRITPEMVRDIKLRLAKGEFQHDIAALHGLNQGRISEINTGKINDLGERLTS